MESVKSEMSRKYFANEIKLINVDYTPPKITMHDYEPAHVWLCFDKLY